MNYSLKIITQGQCWSFEYPWSLIEYGICGLFEQQVKVGGDDADILGSDVQP